MMMMMMMMIILMLMLMLAVADHGNIPIFTMTPCPRQPPTTNSVGREHEGCVGVSNLIPTVPGEFAGCYAEARGEVWEDQNMLQKQSKS